MPENANVRPPPAAPPAAHGVTYREAFRVWLYIGLNSFGGPAGQIAVMHRVLVEQRRWVSEARFLHALNYCMLLPGPEATQLAVYVGWLLHRTLGGLTAGILFVLPGALFMLALSMLYAGFHGMALVAGLFFGLKPAVLAVVLEAVLRIGRRALKNAVMVALAAASFVALFLLEVPYPAVVIAAGLIGLAGSRFRPAVFQAAGGPAVKDESLLGDDVPAHARPSGARAARVLAVSLALWFGPLALLAAWGAPPLFLDVGVFFSKAAVVTFGGAYSVLAYIAQQAVETYGWLKPGEMLEGLGLAETTPGPLILVTQFIGFLAGYRHPGGWAPMAAGAAAAALTAWVTFLPSFLFIFLGAPYIEALRRHRGLSAALSAITAAVVGVVLNLAVWFGLHTLFGTVNDLRGLGLRLLAPDWASVSWPSVALAVGAAVALFRLKAGMLLTLGASAGLGLLYVLAFGLPAP